MHSARELTPLRNPPLEYFDSTHARWRGRSLLVFAGSNYLGLSAHPQIHAAMKEALDRPLTQPGASRRTTGDHLGYHRAERAVARFFRQPASALLPCGYLAPLAAVQALRPHLTHLVMDAGVHACVKDAVAVGGLPTQSFAAGDASGLRAVIRSLPRSARPLVLSDGLYGTRGGIAPLKDYLAQLPKQGWMLVDDAHGAGAAGPGGRGAVAHHGLRDPRIVQTISLAKAFGVGGGAVLGPKSLIADLLDRVPAFIGTTSMPLTVVAGIEASLRVIQAEPERHRRLIENMQAFHAALPKHPSLSNSPHSPITTLTPVDAVQAAALSKALLRAGIYPSLIRYLTGPATGFFRFALSADHTLEDVRKLAAVLRQALEPDPAV